MTTVVDQLRTFRYVTSSRALPWQFVRALDVSRMKTTAPDLQQLKNIVSAISDCKMDDTTLAGVNPAETLQLLMVAQIAVQFLIHSQGVLKLQLAEAQNRISVSTIASQHVLSLEAKVESLKKRLEEAEAEKLSMRQVMHSLEKGTVELHTRAQCLEKEVEYERSLRAQQATRPQQAVADPALTMAGKESAEDHHRNRSQRHHHHHHRPHVHSRHGRHEDPTISRATGEGRYCRPDGLVDDDVTSGTNFDTENVSSAAEEVFPGGKDRRSRNNRNGGPPAATPLPTTAPSQFVDWASFTMLMLQHQKSSGLPPAAPALVTAALPSPSPLAREAEIRPDMKHHTEPVRERIVEPLESRAVVERLVDEANEHLSQQLRAVTASVTDALAAQASSTLRVSDTLARLDAKVSEQAAVLEQAVGGVAMKFEASLRKVQDQLKDEVRMVVRDEVSKQQQQSLHQRKAGNPDLTLLNLQDLQQHVKAAAATTAPSSQPNSRACSPYSQLPPLALAAVVGEPDGGANQLVTPSSVQGFGPRVVSESHVTSDDDDDDPYIPMSVQLQTQKGQPPPQQEAANKQKTGSTPQATAAASVVTTVDAASVSAVGQANLSASRIVADGSGMLSADVSLSSNQPMMQRKASSKMLKDTQDELQRLLAEEAADEARRRGIKEG
jgi:hypothetical protein